MVEQRSSSNCPRIGKISMLKFMGQSYILYLKRLNEEGNILFLPLNMAISLRDDVKIRMQIVQMNISV